MNAIIKATIPNSQIGRKLQAYIYDTYKRFYNAEVHSNPDRFIYVEENGEICAGFGITFASNRKLFSEQYINLPVEEYISKLGVMNKFGSDLRYNIAEISSCVAIKKGYGLKLYKMLPIILTLYRIDYSLVTLTEKVQQIFANLNFEIEYLTCSDKSRVDRTTNWGTFYESNPKTYLFDIINSLPNCDFLEYANKLQISFANELINLYENDTLAS